MEQNPIEAQKEKLKKINDIFKLIKEKEIKMIDLRFTDLPGEWQHFSTPASYLRQEHFYEGFGFDGSSIRGWKEIYESDMLAIPDPSTAHIDPFIKTKTLSMLCDIIDPITKEHYDHDPRVIAKRAIKYLKSTKLADNAYYGSEAKFFIFDNVTDNISEQETSTKHNIKVNEGDFPLPPSDTTNDLRNTMVQYLIKAGMDVELQHYNVATGQSEIDFEYCPMLECCDNLQMFKYIIKNTASEAGKEATFMPKPNLGNARGSMHTHISLWKDGKPLFAGNKYAGLSEMALHFIGGLLKHAPSLLALTNSATKSLVPGYETPIYLVYSMRNRSAAIRIPMYSDNPKAKRIEFRCPDGTTNHYLAFSAMLLAGLDGVINKIDPGEPIDKDVYHLNPDEHNGINQAPETLELALQNLENDNEYLKQGGVFTDELIKTWIKYKRNKEV